MSAMGGPFDASAIQCPPARFAVHAYVDGEFEVLEAVSLEHLVAHLASCASCADYLEHLRLLKEKLRCSCGCAAPTDLETRILTRITQLSTDGDTFTFSEEIEIQRN